MLLFLLIKPILLVYLKRVQPWTGYEGTIYAFNAFYIKHSPPPLRGFKSMYLSVRSGFILILKGSSN